MRMLKAAQDGNLQELQLYFRCKDEKFLLKDNHGWTALHFAAVGGYIDVVQFLQKQESIDPEAETHEGETALFCALTHGASIKMLKALLSVGRDIVNINNNEMFSPLMKACTLSLEHVMLIVDAGANINNLDFDNFSALSVSVRLNKPDIVEYLLHIGADAQVTDLFGLTPLMQAAYYGHKRLIQMIIDFTVDINAKNIDGMTALMFGAQYGDYDIIDTLLNNGADFMLLANDGTCALSYAINEGTLSNVKRLLRVMTDKQITHILDITDVEFSVLYLSLYRLNTYNSKAIKVVSRFVELIAPKALMEYDNTYGGLIGCLTDFYFCNIIKKYQSHAEYVLQVLIMKGMSFDGVLGLFENRMESNILDTEPKIIINIFNLYIKYGFNFYYPQSGFKLIYSNNKKYLYLQESKLFNISYAEDPSSEDENSNVCSLQELSRRVIAEEVAKRSRSTQRYILKMTQLPLPKRLTNYVLELKE